MKYTAEEFQKKLRRWAKKAPNKLRKQLGIAGAIIQEDVQHNRLMGQVLGERSGDLRRSIHHEESVNLKGVRLRIGTNQTSKKGFPYGRYWEELAKIPRPFLKPAVASKKQKVMELIAKGMMEAYKKA